MAAVQNSLSYVRTEEAPMLAPPASMVGVRGWLMANLFSSWKNTLITAAAVLFLYWILSDIFDWAIYRAVWTGENREVCAVPGVGACWPFVWAKFPQWVYGFYPIEQRWRVNICFLVGALALVPMLMPSMPHKTWNALFLLLVFPLMSLVLLTGGNFSLSYSAFASMASFLAIAAVFLPLFVYGIEEGIQNAKPGLVAVGLGILVWLSSWIFSYPVFSTSLGLLPSGRVLSTLLFFAGGAAGVAQLFSANSMASRSAIKAWLVAAAVLFLAMLILKIDFGLEYVETSQWGGLLVTLVVAITGIVASLPFGILLALGRRSNMPIVKYFSVSFIEIWRGVPLITVLFMASVMLPLFLPPGTNFDKLTRALIATAIFSSAYMAEVVRGGLQAIPKGQFEAAEALGLSFWKMMGLIVLPQALKIVIPGIVNSFISLFKNTTLVTVIGIYDLLGIVQAGFADSNWASPQTGPTGYFTVAALFWVFCFSMSRYSQYVERRLNTGHKR